MAYEELFEPLGHPLRVYKKLFELIGLKNSTTEGLWSRPAKITRDGKTR
jgi:hypothetical protein